MGFCVEVKLFSDKFSHFDYLHTTSRRCSRVYNFYILGHLRIPEKFLIWRLVQMVSYKIGSKCWYELVILLGGISVGYWLIQAPARLIRDIRPDIKRAINLRDTFYAEKTRSLPTIWQRTTLYSLNYNRLNRHLPTFFAEFE